MLTFALYSLVNVTVALPQAPVKQTSLRDDCTVTSAWGQMRRGTERLLRLGSGGRDG
ncbi:hypothetical protein SVIO_051820 [Streptomyces violaceusniger]|uniref:Uncharacterized protein n=1 Tax=Streptomyces violaceusniger TaxID=68280 RepID=A0A4D4L982_STRVO|nr:hypothetical protein SVIO_051820 [Streptomyces violaceusniger]